MRLTKLYATPYKSHGSSLRHLAEQEGVGLEVQQIDDLNCSEARRPREDFAPASQIELRLESQLSSNNEVRCDSRHCCRDQIARSAPDDPEPIWNRNGYSADK